jgi:MFS family permease
MARWIRWGATQLFFALSVLCSVTFAITSPSLLGSLGLGEAQLGALGGAYVTAFSIALLLLGGLMSTIPTRLLLGGSALVAALGTLLLASSQGFAGALLAMVLMGIGLSTAFVGVISTVGREFPRNFPFMAALSNAITNLGSALLAIGSRWRSPRKPPGVAPKKVGDDRRRAGRKAGRRSGLLRQRHSTMCSRCGRGLGITRVRAICISVRL